MPATPGAVAGNVVVRTKSQRVNRTGGRDVVQQTLRSDQIYYDVEQNRAIALSADLEVGLSPSADPVHMRGREIWRLGKDDEKKRRISEILERTSKEIEGL